MNTPQLTKELDKDNTKGAIITNSVTKETTKTNKTGQSKHCKQRK